MAQDHSSCRLFKQLDHNSFEKLGIDWGRLKTFMEQHGSALVFGGWADWSCPFELKYLQQPRNGMAFGAEVAFMRGGPGSMLRPATKTRGKSDRLSWKHIFTDMMSRQLWTLTAFPPSRASITWTPKVCRITAFWAIFRGLGHYFTYFGGFRYSQPCYACLLAREPAAQKLALLHRILGGSGGLSK